MEAQYPATMEYIEACHMELLSPHKSNRKRIGDMASITPEHPALLLSEDMFLFNEWCDTAHMQGEEDAIVDRDKADKATVLYCVTGYRGIGQSEMLTAYPAIVHTLHSYYAAGYENVDYSNGDDV